MYVDAEIDSNWFNNFSEVIDLGIGRALTRFTEDPITFMIHGNALENVSHVLVQDSDDKSSWGSVMAFTIPQDQPFYGPVAFTLPPLSNTQRYLRFQLVGSGVLGEARVQGAMNIQGQY